MPQLDDVLFGCEYYWVAAQAEYSTDVMFKTAAGLRDLYPRLLSHSTLCFGAREVMNFLGRKLNGNFQGEVVSDLSSLVCRRVGGSRIKHRVKQNWLKMYDKAGLVLRIETVINNPGEFRVRKQVLRDGKQRTEWVQLRKGVAYLFRYREVSLQANARYLDALAVVDDPTQGKQALQRLTTAKKDAAGRSCPGFNPLAQPDATLFKSLMAGEHCLHGFTNRDIRARLTSTQLLRSCADDSVEGKCKGRPVLQAPACPRPDRQDSTHAPLASHQLRPQRHGHFDVPARAPLPQRLLRRRALIIFAKNKELTEKESILCPGSIRSWFRVRLTLPCMRFVCRPGVVSVEPAP